MQINLNHFFSFFQAKGGWYNVQTGRRDGSVSSAQDVNLPSPSFNIPEAVAAFASKGLDVTDMVYLLGTSKSPIIYQLPFF